MTNLYNPDKDLLQEWLASIDLPASECEQCPALHLGEEEFLPGLIEARLYVEPWGLLLRLGFELRPTAILRMCADLGPLNLEYPTLKLFVDVDDESTPVLSVWATLLTGAGLTPEQFTEFAASAVESARQLAYQLDQHDYLYTSADGEPAPPRPAVH